MVIGEAVAIAVGGTPNSTSITSSVAKQSQSITKFPPEIADIVIGNKNIEPLHV